MPRFDDYIWVPLYRALNPLDVRLIAAPLHDAGVPVTYRNDGYTAIPTAFGLLADFVILVPQEFYDRALAMLVEMGVIEEDADEDFDEA